MVGRLRGGVGRAPELVDERRNDRRERGGAPGRSWACRGEAGSTTGGGAIRGVAGRAPDGQSPRTPAACAVQPKMRESKVNWRIDLNQINGARFIERA